MSARILELPRLAVLRVYLEELARQRVYALAFIAGSLKLRGADAAPPARVARPRCREPDAGTRR